MAEAGTQCCSQEGKIYKKSFFECNFFGVEDEELRMQYASRIKEERITVPPLQIS